MASLSYAHLNICLFLLLSLASVSFAGTLLPCPNFSCVDGAYEYGRFVDAADPSEESTNWLAEFYFTAGQGYNYPFINDDDFLYPQLDCYLVCKNYNLQITDENRVAHYWMYEQTCGTGGICSCFSKSVCEANNWSDEWQEPAEYPEDDYEPAANFTAGKICGAKGKGDPHFSGADGSHFDFSGSPNKAFALISDAHLQVNMFLGGWYGKWNKGTKAMTWIRKLSILWGHHTVTLQARQGADAAYNEGYMQEMTVDGEKVVLAAPGDRHSAVDNQLTIVWVEGKVRSGQDFVDIFEVSIRNVLRMRLTLRPEVRVLRRKDDGLVHFTVDVLDSQFSSNVHGVLGQTFRPDFAGRLAHQKLVYSDLLGVNMVPGDNAEGFIDGTVEDYQVTELLRSDCRLCRFARQSAVDEETAYAMALTGSATSSFSNPTRKALVGTMR